MKLFKAAVSLLMVVALCGLLFVGCASSDGKGGKDNNGKDTPNYDNMTPSEHFAALELNNANGMVDALSAVYGALSQSANTASYGTEMDVSLQVGDLVLDMLEESYYEASGEEMDFSFLSKVNLEVDLNVKDKMQQMDMAVGLGDSRILTICTIMDLEDFTTWVGSPELSDVFAEMNLVQSGGMGGMVANNATMQTANALVEALPSEQEFNALIKRYLEVALEKIDDVDRKNITLELDGLKQDCTVLVAKIYEEDALNMAEAVLETAKTDKELKKIIEEFGVALNDLMKESYAQAGGTWTNVDVYEAFTMAVEDALDSLEMEKEDLDTEEYIELTTYVDKEHNIIGRKLAFDGDEMHYYTVTEGNAFTFEAMLAEVKATGSGTKKSGKVDGTYKLNVAGSDLFTLEVKDWSANGEEIKGTLVLEPSAELIRQTIGNSGVMPFADVALELKIDSSESKKAFEINLLSNEALVVGIAMSTKTSSGGTIQKPSQTIDFNNQYQLQSWVESMDFDKLIRNLRNAGVPGELLDMLEANLFG
ncbi:MAG: hypothetical protein J6Q30_02835 [Oscillospiraceae bacterium]|nr:hypothetical protein [Oscillospiraceae bacterium]